MPFNMALKFQKKNCNIMAKDMLGLKIPFKTVVRKVVKAYNVNQENPTLKPHKSKWGSQRNACINGIRKVYGRNLKEWDRNKQKFVEIK